MEINLRTYGNEYVSKHNREQANRYAKPFQPHRWSEDYRKRLRDHIHDRAFFNDKGWNNIKLVTESLIIDYYLPPIIRLEHILEQTKTPDESTDCGQPKEAVQLTSEQTLKMIL